jgi:multiple sugar transport system permease protein
MTPAVAVPPQRRAGISSRLDRLSEAKFGLLMFLPALIIIGIFVLPPILAVFGMSVFRIELLKSGPTNFVGINNFVTRMPIDQNFVDSIWRTIWFAFGATIVAVPLALMAALVMNRTWRFSTLIGIGLLLPWAIAPVVTGFYWRFMFQPSFGIMTILANDLGLAHGDVAWLQTSGTAFVLAIVATAWRTVPLLGLLLLAGLRTIPASQYRAARMDGAGAWSTFRFITLPAIRPTLIVATVLTIITALQTFDIFFQLTQGGPGFETTTMVYYIFEAAINNLSLGYSAALALILLFIIVVFSSLVFLIRGRRQGRIQDDDDLTVVARPARGLLATPALAAGVSGAGVGAVTGRTANQPVLGGGSSASATAMAPVAAATGAVAMPAPLATGRTDRYEDKVGGRRVHVPEGVQRALFGFGTALFIVWSVFPTAWILISSFEPEGAVTGTQLALTFPTIDHFTTLLQDPAWLKAIGTSLEVALATTILAIVIGSLAAYPLARLEVPGKRLFLGVMIFTQMVPEIVLAIPVLLIFRTIGILDSALALILVNTAFLLPLVIWLLRNMFLAVPKALESSARIDGATRLGTLFRITIPAASSGIAATAILLIILTWNEFMFAVVLGNTQAVTVTRRIGFINSPTTVGAAQPPYTLQAAAGVIAVLPCVILVFLFFRRISAGLTEGYVKG